MSEKSTRKVPNYAVEPSTARNRPVFRPQLRRWSSHTAEESYNLSESGLKKEIPDKTAWRMMKQIRKLMADSGKLLSPVEIDEASFGGSDANKHSHLRGKAKTPVLGIVERHGRVIARVLPDTTKDSILPVVGEVLHPHTMIYSDQSATLAPILFT